MKLKLIAVGGKMPDWVEKGVVTYSQRMPKDCTLELIPIAAAKRSKNQTPAQWMEKEAQAILSAIDKSDWVVALDVKGKSWSTPELADQITQWQQRGGNVSLLVGGPDGLANKCLERANVRWSLSALTLPHPLVRVILAETLYRAWTLTVNHPYHRE